MGRTVPSFRNVLEMEKEEWKPFRNALPKSERKSFDEMWDIPKPYIMACSNSVSLVPFLPIAVAILFHHYKELRECSKQVERMMMMDRKVKVKIEDLQKIKEEHFQPRQQLTLSDFQV
jgi:predicted transcriptional regulator